VIRNFEITLPGLWSKPLQELQITDFAALCNYVHALPYGRNADRINFYQVLSESRGSCSSKHGLLATIAEAHEQTEIHLMVGIFLMSAKTHPVLTEMLASYGLTSIPEAHAYFRCDGQRYDFTFPGRDISAIEAFIVREQRCEPNQLVEWKPMIHRHYIDSWVKRQASGHTAEQIWEIREACIALLSENEEKQVSADQPVSK
jgi:hypothetical protein